MKDSDKVEGLLKTWMVDILYAKAHSTPATIARQIDQLYRKQWISVEDRLPGYGEPVILSIKGVVQNVTYTLDGADDTRDWFEPYHFEADDAAKLWWNEADHWQPLPEPPESKDEQWRCCQ